MWPSKTLGLLYSKLYAIHEVEAFPPEEIAKLLGDRLKAKVYAHRLRRIGWLYDFPALKAKTLYRLHRPEVCLYLSTGMVKSTDRLRQREYSGLVAVYLVETLRSLKGLKSVVLYGSLARGRARRDSDVDLLVVLDNSLNISKTLDRLLEIEQRSPIAEEIGFLQGYGIDTHISPLPMSVNRLSGHPNVLLDIVFDGIVLYDDEAFAREGSLIKDKLTLLGAKRVFINEDEWYWDLMPTYKPGMVVEI